MQYRYWGGEGKLCGDYSRWNDLYYLECEINCPDNEYAKAFWRNHSNIAIVKPCDLFEGKQQLLEKWREWLENNVLVKVIDRRMVPECMESVDYILFVDEDELRATETLYRNIVKDERWKKIKATTCKKFENIVLEQMANGMVETLGTLLLKELKRQGVQVLGFEFEENANGYLKKLNQKIEQRKKEMGVENTVDFPYEMKRDFFGEIYNEEYAKVITAIPHTLNWEKGIPIIADQDDPLMHISNGERVTEGQPDEYERCIYMFGPCSVLGGYVEDKHTIASFLQTMLNEKRIPCKVVNQGLYNLKRYYMADFIKIADTPFKTGDIILLDKFDRGLEGIPYINLTDTLEEHDVSEKWFKNNVRHVNYKVNMLYAETLLKVVEPMLKKSIRERSLIDNYNTFVGQHYICKYFSEFKSANWGRIGSIVMNCNPFTLGHRYLIEEATKKVDKLIVFVVEQDDSLFSFDERYAMVCAGVSDLNNVMVVPSGNLIISKETFPQYSVKVADERLTESVDEDVFIFAEYIAPKLNIKYRFVGEEPLDIVTNEYNNAMKRILPSHGIEVIIIPRKQCGDKIISASCVRKNLEAENIEAIDELVPESTKKILFRVNR